MRRRVRVLSALALAGVLLGFAASSAFAEPAAEASPSSTHPGGSVTVSVTCDPTGGPAPSTLDATSQAFEEGTVALHKVAGNDEGAAGPAYRGTARIASAAELEGGVEPVGPDTAWTVDGTCPAAPGGQGKQWSATLTVAKGGAGTGPRPCPAEEHREPCPPAVVQKGVRAGEGGSFTDSVPVLVAGGVCIAAALGGAVYRLRRKGRAADI
ncbi:hypothetical protein [Streptomyces cupreus]|uniref:LPXTG cell wall anchor domain-containing protein n=1 Tax=Streptomyces cupreus TaxID=2759956 RepID=A0A7X1J2U5_9ACTN|nr:hypothetical protein [Streptomyces cupreus]MBC2903104.1 hypothetical protein [Streptomyces cupreus]